MSLGLIAYKGGQRDIAIALGSILFINAFAQKLSEIVSVSSFFTNVGVSQIVWVWGLDGVLILAITGLQSMVIDKYSRLRLMQMMAMGIALCFAGIQVSMLLKAPLWLSQSLLYLLSQQQWLAFPLIFWTFTNDVLDMSQTKRLIPKIASWGFLGAACGIAFTSVFSVAMGRLSLPPQTMVSLCMLINVGIYIGIFWILQTGFSTSHLPQPVPEAAESLSQNIVTGARFIHKVPLFRYLSLIVLIVVICETILDFQFFKLSFERFPDFYVYQVVQGFYLLGRAIVESLISQLVAQKLIAYVGLKSIFVLQPVFSIVASLTMLLVPGFAGAVLGICLQKNTQYGIDEPARKTLQGMIPSERRGRVSICIDSYTIALGGILGALLIAVVEGSGIGSALPAFLIWPGLMLSILALVFSLQLRDSYTASLFDWRLTRRKRGRRLLDGLTVPDVVSK